MSLGGPVAASQAALAYGVSLGSRAIHNLALLLVVAKFAGAEAYGLWALVFATGGFFVPFLTLSLEKSVARLVPSSSPSGRAVLWTTALVTGGGTLVGGAIVLVLFAPVIEEYLGSAHSRILPSVAALVIGWGLLALVLEYLRATIRPWAYALLSCSRDAGGVAVVFVGLAAGFSINAVIATYAAWLLAVAIAGIGLSGGLSRTALVGARLPALRKMVRFSGPMVLSHPIAWVGKYGHIYVIAAFMGLAPLGAYQAAHALADSLQILSGLVLLPLGPLLAQAHDKSLRGDTAAGMASGVRGVLLFSAPAVAASAVFATPLLVLVATQEVASQAAGLLPLLVGATAILGIAGILGESILLTHRTRYLILQWSVLGVILLSLNVVLLPAIGLIGSAVAELVAFSLLFVSMLVYSRRQLGFRFPFVSLVCAVAAALGAATAAWVVPGAASGLWGLGLFSLVYVGLLFATEEVSLTEVRRLVVGVLPGHSRIE